MSKYVTLCLQQNLARRHMPTASLNHLLDELAPFSFLTRDLAYLEKAIASSAFPHIMEGLRELKNAKGVLPRIIPIACIQEPNISNGKPTGFPSKTVLFSSNNPRAAIVALKNARVTQLAHISSRDSTWAQLHYGNNKLSICSFYSDINLNRINLGLQNHNFMGSKLLIVGDSNAHSTLWGSQENNTRGDIWEQYVVHNNLSILNQGDSPTFSNHIGSSCIDLSLTNDPYLVHSLDQHRNL